MASDEAARAMDAMYGNEAMRAMGERMRAAEQGFDYHEESRALKRSVRRKQKRIERAKRKADAQPQGDGGSKWARSWANKRRRVYERDGHKCVECGTDEDLTLDHIRPLLHGGSNSVRNLQTMCAPCNNAKGNQWDGTSGHP